MLSTTKKVVFIVCVLLFFSRHVPIHSRSIEKQAVLAVLTLNLARYTRWPERVFSKDIPLLNLCVIGDNVVQASFVDLDNTSIKGKTLRILNRTRLRNLAECHLIYVSELERRDLKQALLEVIGRPVLTVGEDSAFLKARGMVSLEKINGKIQLSINLPIVKQSGLVISSRILKLATIVDLP
jgi:hypothetical protein